MLFLIDDKRVNDGLTGGATTFRQYPITAIERIEVIRGPGSALYGANAFLGVVSIITDKSKGASVQAMIGDRWGWNGRARYSSDVGPFKIAASLSTVGFNNRHERPAREPYPANYTDERNRLFDALLQSSYKDLTLTLNYSRETVTTQNDIAGAKLKPEQLTSAAFLSTA